MTTQTGSEPTMEARRGGRRGRRGGGERRGGASPVQQPAFRRLRNPYPPMQVISHDELEAIHEASLTVLEEIGIDFLLPEARDRLKAAGASVQGERVRMERGFVERYLAMTPSRFTLHARDPNKTVEIGGDEVVVCQVASTPNVSDRAHAG